MNRKKWCILVTGVVIPICRDGCDLVLWGGIMSQVEIDKIRQTIDEYRHFKIKFIQFSKLVEAFLSEEQILEIEIGSIQDARMEMVVCDTPVTVTFCLIFTTEDIPIGQIDFMRSGDGLQDEPLVVYSLYFNQLGHILDSVSDSFSNRRISDEFDVPFVLHRFLQKFMQTFKMKEVT